MKRRGRAGGITSAQPNYWGPYSRAYCIRQSYNGTGVFVASNHNDYVAFRVWNFSGAQINNVALLLNDNVTHVCDLPNLANGGSAVCFWFPGSSSGFVRLCTTGLNTDPSATTTASLGGQFNASRMDLGPRDHRCDACGGCSRRDARTSAVNHRHAVSIGHWQPGGADSRAIIGDPYPFRGPCRVHGIRPSGRRRKRQWHRGLGR
jgi:hypothetical protein